MSEPSPGPAPNAGEFEIIRWLRGQVSGSASVLRGIGDDAAVLSWRAGAQLVVTTDMLMDGRHFDLADSGPVAAGYKAIAVNVSDIAAMAARPVGAVVAVALPKGAAAATARGLQEGLNAAAERFGVALVGGDTNAWEGPLVVSVTVFGETTDRGPVYRSGARPGDFIFVTGPLGGSLLGRHLRPEPRVAEALRLHQATPIHAMIDVSDGLASDIGHVLEESGGLGARLFEASIPIHDDAVRMSLADGRTPLDHALNDGEDFELCLTLSPEAAARVTAGPPDGVRLIHVGEVVAEPGLWLRSADGREALLSPAGFDHLR